jgi:hypothetical protein
MILVAKPLNSVDTFTLLTFLTRMLQFLLLLTQSDIHLVVGLLKLGILGLIVSEEC